MSQTSSHAQGAAPRENFSWNRDWSDNNGVSDSPHVSPRSKPTETSTTDPKDASIASESADIPRICIQDSGSEAPSGSMTTKL
ncbi:hypothetical protein V865_006311 [Kwoniella europaea PYCC6329]|uniref:Uncharacterized protein n=1 Tax=Kwoniella europaea PYCC6329 TaxID=1423913 RepID=A0AAX4KRK8_9TREE